MARLSTGQSYGDTEQQTSQRLVGAAEQTASGGELARQQMAQLAIQPQAAPVNTFQQVGAPTLGGPVKFSAPPDLPQPNQDLMALAKSFGELSTGLQEFYVTKLKADQEQADAAGRIMAQELSRTYPGQQFVEIRDALYRKAQPADGSPGDPEAQRMYERLQAMSPLQQAYTQRQLARAVMTQALSSAPDRFAQMTSVPGPDGRPIDISTLRPGDPLLLQAKAGLLPLITDPVVAKEFEPQIYSLNIQLDSAQAKLVRTRQQRDAEFSVSQRFEADLAAGLPKEQLAQNVGQLLSEARTTLGIDGFQGLMSNLPKIFKSVQEKLSLQAGTDRRDVTANLADKISHVLRATEVGPPGAGITLGRMLGGEGGAAAEVELYRSSMAILREVQQNDNTTASVDGQNLAEQASTMFNVNEPGISPVERERRKAGANQWLLQQNVSPTTQLEATSQLNRIAGMGETAYDQPAQREAQRQLIELENSLVDPNQKLIQLDRMIQAGFIDPQAAQTTRGRIERERAQRAQPESKEYDAILKNQVDRLKTTLGQAGSNSQGLSQEEIKKVAAFERNLRIGLANVLEDANNKRLPAEERRKAVLEYLTNEGNKLQTTINRGTDTSRQALIPDIKRYYEQRGPVRSSRPPMGPQLAAAVDAGVVMPKAEFDAAVTDYVFNNKISPEVGQIIKDAGYGSKAGEFFEKQWRKVHPGIEMRDDFRIRFRSLNGQQLSFAGPAAGTTMAPGFAMITPRANTYLNLGALIRGAANTALNTTMGSANAATVPTAIDSGRWASGPAVQGSHPDSGSGWLVPNVRDELGRPVLLSMGAANSFAAMIRDSGGVVRGADVASSKRTAAKNANVSGAEGSQHLSGNAIDVHGSSNEWMKRNAASYGWKYVDYPGTHGGHFEFVGGEQAVARATTRTGGGMTGYATYYTGGGGQDGVAGGPTANGERFNPRKLTAAVQWSMRDKYLNKWLVVEDLNTGKSVRVWANDVGQMGGTERAVDKTDPRIIDLSPAAFTALFGGLGAGKSRIRVRIDRNQKRS